MPTIFSYINHLEYYEEYSILDATPVGVERNTKEKKPEFDLSEWETADYRAAFVRCVKD